MNADWKAKVLGALLGVCLLVAFGALGYGAYERASKNIASAKRLEKEAKVSGYSCRQVLDGPISLYEVTSPSGRTFLVQYGGAIVETTKGVEQ